MAICSTVLSIKKKKPGNQAPFEGGASYRAMLRLFAIYLSRDSKSV